MSWLPLVPAASLVLVLGCSGDDYPRPPFDEGGGPCIGCPGGGPSIPDGGSANDGGGVTISGVLCQLSDPRQPTLCDNLDYDGIPVTETVGGASTTADTNGFWELSPPTMTTSAIVSAAAGDVTRRNAVVGVELGIAGSDAGGIVGGASGVIVPLLDATFWADLQTNIGAVEQNNTATILVYARNGIAPLAGATVLSPTGEFTPANTYYENIIVPGPDAWDLNGPTGPFGAAVIFNATTADGLVDVEMTDGLVSVTASVPVVDGAISVVTLDISDGI